MHGLLHAITRALRDNRARMRPHVVRRWLLAVVASGLLLAVLVLTSIPVPMLLYLAYIGVSLLLAFIGATTLVWMLYAWRSPDSLTESRLCRIDVDPAHSFSLIVPARHESAVLKTTITRLLAADHPAFEVIVVVGDDDPQTREIANLLGEHYPDRLRVVVDSGSPKNKPRALNAGLPYCRGTITGVFDAEDDVHPMLLRRVDQCFQRDNPDIVQAGVQLMNFRSSYLTVHNVLEYYFWFRSRLHRHASQRFIPLGGNTVFIRTEVLKAASGWDSECLAEDCELGVRLSALGARTAVFYEPEVVTREECPPTLRAFVRQRTRWNQGYLQTLSKGFWRQLPLRQRALGVYILAMPFAMAIAWIIIPVAITTAVTLKAPVPITLLSFFPTIPLLCMLVAELVGLGEFCRLYGQRASLRDRGRLVLGLPLYQAVLTFAAARAVVRERRGLRGWEKTAHPGLHLTRSAGAAGVRYVPRHTLPTRAAALGTSANGFRVRLHTLLGGRSRRWAPPEPILADSLGSDGRIGSSQPWPSTRGSQLQGELNRTAVAVMTDVDGAPPIEQRPDLWSEERAEAATCDQSAQKLTSVDGTGSADDRPLWVRLEGLPAADAPSVPQARPDTSVVRLAGVRLRTQFTVVGRIIASRTDLVVLVGLLTAVGLVVGDNLLHWPGTQFDEGTYVANAWSIQHARLAPYTYAYGHPPFAWLLMALWTSVGGLWHAGYSIESSREFMFAVTLVSCALLYGLARRLSMSRIAAVGAVLLFALSPVGLFYHRQVLLDNVATAFLLAAFLFAWTPGRRLWAFVASGVCAAAALLSKETTFVILPALLIAVAQNSDRRTRRYSIALFVSSFLLTAAFYPLYATLKGELLPGPHHVSLLGYLVIQLFTRKGTGSVLDPHSQTYAIVTTWLHLDPWLLGIASALVPIALWRRSTRAVTVAYLLQVATIFRPGYLPNMYVIGMLPFAALMVTGSIEALARFAVQRHLKLQLPAVHGRWSELGVGVRRVLMMAGAVASALAVAVFVGVGARYVVPRWMHTDRWATTATQDVPERSAERWLIEHVNHKQRLIVGDQYWIFLITHGFNDQPMRGGFFSKTVVSFWPLDYDPAVKRAFPAGWRDFNYIVVNQPMVYTLNQTPTAAAAIHHSRVVASFGHGQQLIQIRAIAANRPPSPPPP